jgi:hypothetical protein
MQGLLKLKILNALDQGLCPCMQDVKIRAFIGTYPCKILTSTDFNSA